MPLIVIQLNFHIIQSVNFVVGQGYIKQHVIVLRSLPLTEYLVFELAISPKTKDSLLRGIQKKDIITIQMNGRTRTFKQDIIT